MKYAEYQFISSCQPVAGTNYFTVNFVPMRFSVQTFADLSTWNTTAAKVQSFIGGITQSDYDSGRFSKASIDNLKTELSSKQNDADTKVKYHQFVRKALLYYKYSNSSIPAFEKRKSFLVAVKFGIAGNFRCSLWRSSNYRKT